jgi:hypothetical protein
MLGLIAAPASANHAIGNDPHGVPHDELPNGFVDPICHFLGNSDPIDTGLDMGPFDLYTGNFIVLAVAEPALPAHGGPSGHGDLVAIELEGEWFCFDPSPPE